MNYAQLVIASTLVFLVMFSGCTSLQTFPTLARAGDTIAVAVGSPDGMTRANTTIHFEYDSDGSQVNLTSGVRSIFKLYADPVSGIYKKILGQTSNVDVPSLIQTSGHAPWVTVLVVDLPPGMTAGAGQLLISATSTDYPTIGSHINDLQANGNRIDLEVLPGTGTPAVFKHEFGVGSELIGDLTRLEPVPHALVHPLFEGGGGIAPHPYPQYGGIELKLDLFPDSVISGQDIYLADENMESATDSRRSISYGISNDGINPKMTVMLISPIGMLEYYEARFSLVPQDGVTFLSAPVVTSVSYYDVDGEPAVGPPAETFEVTLY